MLNSGPFVYGLQQRIEELEEENAALRSALGLNADIERWRKMGFTGQESRVVNLLLARDTVTKDQVMWACQPKDVDRRYELADNYPRVVMCNVRRKLKALGASVDTLWGTGWRLRGRDRLKAAHGL